MANYHRFLGTGMVSDSLSSRRVVISGMGLISPLGHDPAALWESLSTGRSGVEPIAALPPGLIGGFTAEARSFRGEIDDFGPLDGEKKKAIRKGLKVMCRESQMGVAAAQRAIADARLAAGNHDPERTGVVFGSDYMLSMPEEFTAGIRECVVEPEHFAFSRWAVAGMPRMSPLWLLKYLPNMPASHIAIYNDLRGHSNSITHREAASLLAVGEAFHVIVRGHADVMVAGATGTRVHPMKAIHARQQEELANNGHVAAETARPFDLHRSGMVLGEGAAAIVVEELEHARARGATIYAEVLGAGSSSVADRHRVAQRDVALANAIRAALRDARRTAADVGFVDAHGLSTRSCDVDECRALAAVFGDALGRLPVTAAKSYFGNLGAGSGLVELIAATLALGRDRLYRVLNYTTPDPECPVAVATSGDAPTGASFLKLNVTPQGQAACVVVGRCD